MGVNAVFKKAQDKPEFITCSIPKKREPEFGFLFENMADHHTIFQGLTSRNDITPLSSEYPEERLLVSFAEDTVNDEGKPTRLVNGLDLERRRRINFYPGDKSIGRYDISYKDRQKSALRREWDSAATCLRSGEKDMAQKLSRDIPNASIINPDEIRVSAICLTARAPYEVLHELPGHNAAVVYEVCNDACVFTSPHADYILGYRKETELEAKEVRIYKQGDTSDARINHLLDISINTLEPYLFGLDFQGQVRPAGISKVCHSNIMSEMHYADTARNQNVSGIEWALMQNVRTWDYTQSSRRDALKQIGATLPSATLLVPNSREHDFRDYFPGAHKYPLFPKLGQ